MKRTNLLCCAAFALALAVACGSSNDDSAGSAGSFSSGAGSTSAGTAGMGQLMVDMNDAGSAGADSETCGGTALDANPTPVNVLLVVDKSLSMKATPTGFGDSKWNGLRTALGAALDASDGKVGFGLDFFPSSNDRSAPLPSSCSLPKSAGPAVVMGSGASTLDAIKSALDSAEPAGATPTAGALGRALDYFSTGAGASLPGAHYVLLATDGGPNCDTALSCEADACTVNMDGSCPANTNCCDPKIDPDGPGKCLDDGATLTMVKELAKAGVKTFVVGIPGTEAYGSTLDALATAGGVPNTEGSTSYFAVSAAGGVTALSKVLTNITTGLITSCELVLESDPPDYEKLNVVVDGTTIPEGTTDGWTLDTTNLPPTIVLQGKTCETVRADGAERLQVTFGCPTEHVK